MKRKKLYIIVFLVALLAAGILITVLKPRNQGLYKVTILPSLGGEYTLPTAINDKGQITGFSAVSKFNHHLFLWDKENGIQDIGPVINDSAFINNEGQIAANMVDPNRNQRAFIWNQHTGRIILPTLGGNKSRAIGINNKGWIVGYAETISKVKHAFIWDDVNGIRDLTPASRTDTQAWSINDSGEIIIYTPDLRLIRENDDKTISSKPIPLFQTHCELNNNGYVIGAVLAQNIEIVLWNSMTRQKTLIKKVPFSPSYNLNDNNQIILTVPHILNTYLINFFNPKPKNFLVDMKIGEISLDGYTPVGNNEHLVLTDINNKGCIIGAIPSTIKSKSVGVLFEPIPEKWEKMNKINKMKK